ncbi:MAG: hydantoinase B/oxoprolinase family protein [Prosthecobacter sp.]|uniref:hydantoinase B/oxoprolinase family protein n=1 Tax=Prosthecobacter sp. TaxID=1965333 RepID=UPI0019EE3577|nr:hydantoinase B/oxoprolinase family protein [Prosthecobacter sp.]MBE2287173.1 hydantoinase B/oxoprolinase family protein [Prosthecobacter sp.]
MKWRIAADTGGTFTDCHALDPQGHESRCKVLSTGHLRAVLSEAGTPARLSGLPPLPDAFLTGFIIKAVAESDSRVITSFDAATSTITLDQPVTWQPGTLLELTTGEEAPVLGARILTNTPPGHDFPPLSLRIATTRATNALLERKGGRIALFITKGFGDLLQIGDQRRSDLFALRHESRPIFHEVICEVLERLDVTGDVLEALDEAAVRVAALDCIAQGITTAAVCLLHGHPHSQHELRVAEILRECGFTHLTLSHQTAAFTKLLPRAQSTVADAYLHAPVQSFLNGIRRVSPDMRVMTSAGGLKTAEDIRPKDMLLSGPAGGAIGAANAARRLGITKIITLDMGGTSTDVARIDGRPGYRFRQDVAGMKLLAPCVAIETVAAGGGSICRMTHHGLAVGPESAGSNPGPACYGKGGPLTITDVNLLLGRFDPAKAPIPLDVDAAKQRLRELHAQTDGTLSESGLLHALLRLAVEHITDAIRRISIGEGYDPADHALLAFGGAGPQHACAVAESLGMKIILVPEHAGILSAVGLQEAVPERIIEKEHRISLTAFLSDLSDSSDQSDNTTQIAELRLKGQDTPLQVEFDDPADLPRLYHDAYQRLFGYPPPAGREIELVSVRMILKEGETPVPPILQRNESIVPTPSLIQDAFSTIVVAPGWEVEHVEGFGHVLSRTTETSSAPPALERDLLRHRFHAIVSDMGALLCRTAISTNIRERLDFSCALLDPQGRLLSSAPHIPVHLGALGVCVREVAKAVPMQPGDTIITNHPAFGGSHLPDVTLITPVHDQTGRLIGYIANRAHHAEIGGITPGSMPANATRLIEEGVVIAPRHLISGGSSCFDEIRELLTTAPHPTRNLADNLADLHAQLAANLHGVERLQALAGDSLLESMQSILDHSAQVMRRQIEKLPDGISATEKLDDGSQIVVSMRRAEEKLVIDFSGTSGVHPRNLNATQAIVRSAVLYVMRLMLQEDLPLNEGLLDPVEIITPVSLLSPAFVEDPAQCPAVVGGNVEVSQRLVDTLIKALRLQACSQGTMNNFLFGGGSFGYYETIAGGSGAGEGHDGASALHTHMTNTAITDPEIIEQRYPVRLRRFAIRRGSGGAGQWHGGDGVVREFEFVKPLTVSLLTQHRVEAPFGLNGGQSGQPGRQTLARNGTSIVLDGCTSFEAQAGDRVVIETPGGGGWGLATASSP